MNTTNAPVHTPLDPGLVARVGQGLRWIVAGVTPSTWMGPNQPIAPIAQEVQGRAFDFPVGTNLQTQPRANEPVTFDTLKGLADAYPLVRLMIETRKDQIARLEWQIQPKKGKKVSDDRIEKIKDFLACPDGEHTWEQWGRMLDEQMLTLDATTIFPRKNKGGGLYSLDILDGSTIKRVLDASGRTPAAPSVAYQQVLKGVPAADYTRDELIYAPRNPRVHKVYGFSPVEQIVLTINIGLRRETSQLQFYTEGNIPEMLVGVPKEWGTKQLREMQDWFDSNMAGNTAAKRKLWFIPGGMDPKPTKDIKLKDEYDEWLARVVAFAFSVSPTALVKQVNRGTGETQKDQAMEEGLMPLMKWRKNLLDRIIQVYLAEPDLEFVWQEEQAELDPLIKAKINDIYVKNGVLLADEVREDLGLKPLPKPEPLPVTLQPAPVDAGGNPIAGDGTPSQVATTPTPEGAPAKPAPLPAVQPGTSQPAAKLAKKDSKGSLATPAAKKAVLALTAKVHALFVKQAGAVAKQLEVAIAERFKKADGAAAYSDDDLEWLAGQVDFGDWSSLTPSARNILKQAFTAGGTDALEKLGLSEEESANYAMFHLVNDGAVKFADEKAADLVKGIEDATRDGLKSSIKEALEQGLSTGDLAEKLEESYSFSAERAGVIARTEVARASVAGNVNGYKASGMVKGLAWNITADDVCPICEDNDGEEIELGGTFPSGDEQPPAHPNCQCSVGPVLKPETEDEEV